MNISNYVSRFRKFLKKVKRVIKISTKPEKKEFLAVAKITLLGMAIIGAIGYIIQSISVIAG